MAPASANAPLPTLFVSHGSPSLVLEPSPARDFLAGLGSVLPRPKAIVIASAHWLTDAPTVDTSTKPDSIHDFGGYPDELYAMYYRAPGAPALAERMRTLITGAGLACRTMQRGMDHGAWIPLSLIYPQADIPVVSISLQPRATAAHHLALGRALEPLRREGVLIIGSGSATHNLAALMPGTSAAPPWVSSFDDWLTTAVESGDERALVDYQRHAPSVRHNHATPDHYLPLVVAFGAAGPGAKGKPLHRSFTYGVLSMSAFLFGG